MGRKTSEMHCIKAIRPTFDLMNTIFIRDLRIETRIGVYAWEEHMRQPLLLDIELELPSAKAFTSDSFADALDYSAVVQRLQSFAADHPHKLLERFAEAIADILCKEFGAPWAKVRVAKLAPIAGVKQIGVAIERGTRP
jgi:dihydroneopterin aldolase